MSEDELFVRLPPIRRGLIHQRFRALMQLFTTCSNVPEAVQVAAAIGLTKPLAIAAVGPSLSDLTKCYANANVRRRCAYRLAANADRLAAGWACPAGDYAAGELCEACVIGVEVVLDAGGSWHHHNIGYRVLSGRAAGSQVVDNCRANVLRAIYGQLTGWPRGCHPYSSSLMVGLVLALTLKRDMGLLVADKVGVTRSQRSRNVQLTRKRFREHHDCPVGFGLDCSNCMVGISECQLSVLPIDTYVLTHNV